MLFSFAFIETSTLGHHWRWAVDVMGLLFGSQLAVKHEEKILLRLTSSNCLEFYMTICFKTFFE